MLFAYKYVPHTIERLQTYIDHLFCEVWCEADGEFSIEMLHPDLKDIVMEIYNDDRINIDHLHGPIKEIYLLFLAISKRRRTALKRWYQNNNAIEDLCTCRNHCNPIHYKRLKQLFPQLADKLETFFKNLFTQVIHLKAIRDRIGDINHHYNAFMTENDEGKCPFCGISDILSQYNTKRDAYDHYLPKDIYPFNAVNFNNLAPICHTCNSAFKTTKDPLFQDNRKKRRKAFYPYATEHLSPTLSIRFESKDLNNLSPNDITLTIYSQDHMQECETWMELFGIKERYRNLCLVKNSGKYWLAQMVDEYESVKSLLRGGNLSKADWVNHIISQAKQNPFAEGNFVKAAYVEACRHQEIIKLDPED